MLSFSTSFNLFLDCDISCIKVDLLPSWNEKVKNDPLSLRIKDMSKKHLFIHI